MGIISPTYFIRQRLRTALCQKDRAISASQGSAHIWRLELVELAAYQDQ